MLTNSLLKLPGFVDVHVHLREPGGMHKEDFETGTKTAVAGGYTQILDMPNNVPPTVSDTALNDKIKRLKNRIWCDLGFNFGSTRDSVKYFTRIYKKSFGLKVYMNQTTGSLLVDKPEDRELIFKSWTSPLPIMVHAEGETVEVAISLAKKYKRRLHVCHVVFDQLSAIEKSRKNGLNITCEVCPHHLFLNRDDVKKLGPLGIVKPSLLSKKDKEKLWENLDKIDMISTDHAPHTLEEKYDQSEPASPDGSQGGPKFGVPGLETTLPLVLNAVTEKLLSIERLLEMLSTNPRKIFKLPKQPETYVIVDTSKKYKISDRNLFTKCGWTPFKGMDGRGEVKKVVIRGKTIFDNDKFIGKPKGHVIYPKI